MVPEVTVSIPLNIEFVINSGELQFEQNARDNTFPDELLLSW
jgi:hypothetical protein